MAFVTDGLLLRFIESDFLLKDYSVIIVDEAHERTLNVDLLIPLLIRSMQLRKKMIKENKIQIPVYKILILGIENCHNVSYYSIRCFQSLFFIERCQVHENSRCII